MNSSYDFKFIMISSSLWFQVHNDFKFKCMFMFMSSSACSRFPVMNSSHDFKLCFEDKAHDISSCTWITLCSNS
jgi:Mg2+/Co2+ transporter CorC